MVNLVRSQLPACLGKPIWTASSRSKTGSKSTRPRLSTPIWTSSHEEGCITSRPVRIGIQPRPEPTLGLSSRSRSLRISQKSKMLSDTSWTLLRLGSKKTSLRSVRRSSLGNEPDRLSSKKCVSIDSKPSYKSRDSCITYALTTLMRGAGVTTDAPTSGSSCPSLCSMPSARSPTPS